MLFDLDTLCRALGAPRFVHAEAVPGPTGRLDHAVASLAWDDTRAWCEASYLLAPTQPFTSSLLALGTDAVLSGRFQAPRDGPPQIRVSHIPRAGGPVLSTSLGGELVAAECRHFVEVLRGDADPALLDVEQAILGLQVLDAARASLEDGRPRALDGHTVEHPFHGP